MRRREKAELSFAPLLLVALAAGLGPGCGSLGDGIQLCGQIADGGCPIGRGGTCSDHACAALYDCVGGAWTRTTTCGHAGQGGQSGEGGAGASGQGGVGGAACTPVVIDHTGETSGCAPDLQSPDCPAAAVETCAETACLTDCADFFLCKTEGWSAVAYCNDEGQVVLMP